MNTCIAMLSVGALALACTGCGMVPDRETALQVADKYLDTVKRGALDSLDVFLAPELLEKKSADEIKQIVAMRLELTGRLESYDLVGWQVDRTVGSGVYVILQYRMTYQYEARTEMMTLYSPGPAESLKIIQHSFGVGTMSGK